MRATAESIAAGATRSCLRSSTTCLAFSVKAAAALSAAEAGSAAAAVDEDDGAVAEATHAETAEEVARYDEEDSDDAPAPPSWDDRASPRFVGNIISLECATEELPVSSAAYCRRIVSARRMNTGRASCATSS